MLLKDELFGGDVVFVGDDSGLQSNCCGVLKASEAEIRSAARRRVRKSRGEQEEKEQAITRV